MVFQDVVLFRDTVMENIRLGRRGATDEEVLEAAKAAQCDEFIRKLPLCVLSIRTCRLDRTF